MPIYCIEITLRIFQIIVLPKGIWVELELENSNQNPLLAFCKNCQPESIFMWKPKDLQ